MFLHFSSSMFQNLRVTFFESKLQDGSGNTRNTSTLSKLSRTTLKREEKSSASVMIRWILGFVDDSLYMLMSKKKWLKKMM